MPPGYLALKHFLTFRGISSPRSNSVCFSVIVCLFGVLVKQNQRMASNFRYETHVILITHKQILVYFNKDSLEKTNDCMLFAVVSLLS